MAYGNWGGKVWCNGAALHDNCDVSAADVLGRTEQNEARTWTAEDLADPQQAGDFNRSQHAVVGDAKTGFVVLLYKEGPFYPIFYMTGGKLHAKKVRWELWETEKKSVTINGVKVQFTFGKPGSGDLHNFVRCEFTDFSGRKWIGESGIYHGEGYEEWGDL